MSGGAASTPRRGGAAGRACTAAVALSVPAPRRRAALVLALLAVLALWPWPLRAEPWPLLSDAELAQEAAAAAQAPVPPTPRAVPAADAPSIRVLAPALGAAPLGSPLRIELAFAAAADAEIDPASFRVEYGSLRIDLTARILARVAVTRTGLAVDDVVIPRGRHRLFVRIADTRRRMGEAELRFEVQ